MIEKVKLPKAVCDALEDAESRFTIATIIREIDMDVLYYVNLSEIYRFAPNEYDHFKREMKRLESSLGTPYNLYFAISLDEQRRKRWRDPKKIEKEKDLQSAYDALVASIFEKVQLKCKMVYLEDRDGDSTWEWAIEQSIPVHPLIQKESILEVVLNDH